MINSEGFIQDDIPRVGRLLKILKRSMGEEDREQTVEELRNSLHDKYCSVKGTPKKRR